jgi:hypothetical protein
VGSAAVAAGHLARLLAGTTVVLALDLRLAAQLAFSGGDLQGSGSLPEKSRRRTLQELDVGTMEVQYWFIGLPFFNC